MTSRAATSRAVTSGAVTSGAATSRAVHRGRMRRLRHALGVPGASLLCAFALAPLTSACHVARAAIATPSDYAAYRRVRLARDLDGRVAAAFEYLEEHPEGRFSERVKRYLTHAEPVYFAARSRSADGLEAYLAALPRGPNATLASEKLALERAEARHGDLATRTAHATMLRTEAEDASRKAAAGLGLAWARELLAPEAWRSTFDAAPPKLLVRFRLSAPPPDCARTDDGETCNKSLVRRFTARSPEGESNRELSLDAKIWLDRGYRLARVELSGVELFVRTSEAGTGATVTPVDAKARAQAMRSYSERLQAHVIEDDRLCSGSEGADGVLTLACEDSGIEVRVEPGAAGAPDRMVFARRPPATPAP